MNPKEYERLFKFYEQFTYLFEVENKDFSPRNQRIVIKDAGITSKYFILWSNIQKYLEGFSYIKHCNNLLELNKNKILNKYLAFFCYHQKELNWISIKVDSDKRLYFMNKDDHATGSLYVSY